MPDKAIVLENVSVKFNLSRERVDNVKEYALKKIRKQLQVDEFYALNDVSLSVDAGDSVAIIGENGSGKSTLLKLISGIYSPDSGSVKANGRIAPLIELGAGFDMELTARENIYLNGAVLGHSKKFMKEHFDGIIDFAELRDFVDVPLKNFSSGMVARLGFSIATVMPPDILIVDEILAVGDMNFREKCAKRMEEMLLSGATLLFVSHDAEEVTRLCRRAVWLKDGSLRMTGDAKSVVKAYSSEMTGSFSGGARKETKKDAEPKASAAEAPRSEKRFSFIPYLHVIAALMVLYHHVFEVHFSNLGIENSVISAIRNHVSVPLGIDFGYLGVVLFFLAAGFLNTESLLGKSPGKYLLRKANRIFPPLFVAVGGLYLLQLAVGKITGTPSYWAQFSLTDWLESATLIGHFTGSSELTIGISWFLVPLIIYYLLSALLSGLLKSSPTLYFLAVSATVAAFSFGLSYLGGLWFTLADYIQHIPAILLGEIIYAALKGRIGRERAILLFSLNFFLLLQNIRLFFPESYKNPALIRTPSIVFGIIIFIILLLLEEKLRENAFISALDKLSYTVYLTHYQLAQLTVAPLAATGKLTSSLLILAYLALATALALLEYSFLSAIRKFTQKLKGSGTKCRA